MKKRSVLAYILVLTLVLTAMLPVFAGAETQTAYAVVDRENRTMTFCIGTKISDTEGVRRSDGTYVTGDSYYTDFLNGEELPWFDDGDIIESVSILDPIEPTSMDAWFFILPYVKTITGLGIINTDRLTSANALFEECEELTELDLTGFRAPLVEDMSYMFMGCRNLERLTFDGLGADSATNTEEMFAYCDRLETLDLTGFGGANITNMSYMFVGCTNLKELILDGFYTDSATDMECIFSGCSSLRALDLSQWNLRRDTWDALNMNGMFADCTSLRALTLAQGFVSYRMGNVERLPDPPTDFPYTGMWIRKEYPDYPLDSDGLLNCYDTTLNSKVTWVWQQTPQSLSAAQVSGENKIYTGEALTTNVTVTLNGETLEEGFDYTVSYENNTNAGTASITVTGKNFYFDSASGTFDILQKDLSAAAVAAADRTYTGSEIASPVSVTVDDRALTEGTDFTVDYENNTDAGTAVVTVTGTGNYSGTAFVTFAILAKDLAAASVSVEDQVYTGSEIAAPVTVDLNGTALIEGRDFTVSYDCNVAAGTATVTVTGVGNYSGTASGTFEIVEPEPDAPTSLLEWVFNILKTIMSLLYMLFGKV